MPMTPRKAMAKLTLRGGMPRSPVNAQGRCWDVWVGGERCEGSNRSVERWMNQTLLNVPMCSARTA